MHFDFQLMSAGGMPVGDIQRIKTATGVLLNCPTRMDPEQVFHLCDVARAAPDHPVDLVLWSGLQNDKESITWSARIHWRDGNA